jgi:hypothetical protein
LEKWLEDNKDSETGEYKRPQQKAENAEEKRLGSWISHQLESAKDNQRKGIMKQDGPYNAWQAHVAKYKTIYMSFDEVWFDMLNGLEKWLEEYKDPKTGEYKRPKQKAKDPEEKRLGIWIGNQLKNTKGNQRKEIMKQDGPYNAWQAHVAKYKEIYMSDKEVWFDTLKRLVKWLEDHKDTKTGEYQRPKGKANEDAEEKRLGQWIGTQLANAKDNQRKDIMKQDGPYKAWLAHVAKYKEIYMSAEEVWFDTLKRLEKWLEDHKDPNTGEYQRPNRTAKNAEERRLGSWIDTQLANAKDNQRKCIMKQDAPFKAWLAHVAKYKEIYMSFEEAWFDTLKRLVKWLEDHKDTKTGAYQRPQPKAKNAEEKRLGIWIGHQLRNAKDNQRKKIMKQDGPYNAWLAHVAKY